MPKLEETLQYILKYSDLYLEELNSLREKLRIVKEDNLVLKEQVRYWKWQAVGWGAPDFENFEVKQ